MGTLGTILLLTAFWCAMGYCCVCYMWTERLLQLLVGKKNYVDPNLIILMIIYEVGFLAFIPLWPLLVILEPIIKMKRRFWRKS